MTTCTVINGKTRFLVLPLGLTHVFIDNYVFLVMGHDCNANDIREHDVGGTLVLN